MPSRPRLFAYSGRHRDQPTARRVLAVAAPTVAVGALVLASTGSAIAPSATTADGASALPEPSYPSTASATALAVGSRSVERASRTTTRTSLDQIEASAGAQATKDAAAAAARATADAKAAAAAKAAKRWVLPLKGGRFSSPFGHRWGRLHAGIDLAVPIGTKLGAMSSGTVVFAGLSSGYGNKVEIRYWDGTVSYFGHMSRILVRAGQKVGPGQSVGLSGNTGRSTGPHLHLEIHPKGGAPINPLPWLKSHSIAVAR